MSKQQPTEKVCTKCEVEKPMTDFYIDRSTKDGRMRICKSCQAEYDASRGQTMRRKASLALKDSRRSVRKLESETGREIKDDLTIYDVLITLGDSECVYCQNDIPAKDRSIEHLTPLRDGGSNTFSNIRMACFSCNVTKRDIPLILHFIRESIDARQAARIVYKVAERERISFNEAFYKLSGQLGTYFDNRAAEQIERIKSEESEERTS